MFKKLALAAVLALGSAASANAALVYASSVVSNNQNGTVTKAGRSDATKALGAIDGNFYSLGFGGELVLGFDKLVGGAGFVKEVTFGAVSKHLESASFYTSLDGVTWSAAPILAFNLEAVKVSGQALFAAGPFQFVKIVDTSSIFAGRDGFDVDAVAFQEYVAPVPLPAAGLLMLGGLAGLGLAKRRKKA
jgi:hypothetical protein